MNRTDQQIREMDDWIRAGKQGKARRLLFAINLKRISREQALPLADIARRVNVPRYVLLILKPVVKPQTQIRPPASAKEIAFYATGLSRLGVYDEAEKLLQSLAATKDPEVILFQAYNSMFQWNFFAAIQKLQTYLRSELISPYQKQVGRINLAACLVSEEKWVAAESVLAQIFSEIETDLSTGKQSLLYGNSLEIAAQMAIKRGQLETANELITKAEELLSGSESRYEFFVKKCRAILHLLSDKTPTSSIERLQKIKQEGERAGNWEAVRDLEFYQAWILRDENLFLRLYFGTPFTSYKKRIIKTFGFFKVLPASYDWCLGSGTGTDHSRTRVFDLRKGCELGGGAMMSKFPLLLRLLTILCSDFYRPVAQGTLISKLYPDEFYNPISSPIKADQAISRLRYWFKRENVPLKIYARRGAFRLIASGPYIIRVPRLAFVQSKYDAYFEKLDAQFANKFFTTQQVCEALGLSKAVTQRFLSWGKANKKLTQLAAGRSARYRIT